MKASKKHDGSAKVAAAGIGIRYLDGESEAIEDHLQALGLGFAESIQSESGARAAMRKHVWLRRVGLATMLYGAFNVATHTFPLSAASANALSIIACFLVFFTGFFLMEAASRSLRVLQPLHPNRRLHAQFMALSEQSAAVMALRNRRAAAGRTLRIFDVAQANALLTRELEAGS